MESASEEIRHDGFVPGFIELVEDARVFENCKSWKKKYQAKKHDVFMPLCTPKEYNGYDMVPVLGGGAIQADFARPCPAVVAASSCVSAACVQHTSNATDFIAKQRNIETGYCRIEVIDCRVHPQSKPDRDRDQEEGTKGQEIAAAKKRAHPPQSQC